jgi:hypothetical protein
MVPTRREKPKNAELATRRIFAEIAGSWMITRSTARASLAGSCITFSAWMTTARQGRHFVNIDRTQAGHRLGRQLVGCRAVVYFEQACGEPRMHQLEDMDRLWQVAQAKHAGIAQAGAIGQPRANQRFGGRGEQRLSALGHGQQAGNAIDRRAEVVATAQIGRPSCGAPRARAAWLRVGHCSAARLVWIRQAAWSAAFCVVEGDAVGVADGLEDAVRRGARSPPRAACCAAAGRGAWPATRSPRGSSILRCR